MKALLDWIDDRTGYRHAAGLCLNRTVPGGACFCRVWPCVITFLFSVQAITGLVLWMYYSPGAQTAWESVYYIQHEVWLGWLVRGIHHYSAQVLVGTIALYVIQTVLLGRYRAPREMVFWSAVFLGCACMAMVLTGDLLPWNQNSYWATQVRVRFLTLLPVVGGELFKLAAGGPAFGHLTLTRFFALHAGLFNAVFIGLLALHLWLVRKADQQEGKKVMRAGWHWPDQAWRSGIVCVLAVLLTLWLVTRHSAGCHAGVPRGDYLGAPHLAPADPSEAYAAARPEWSLLGVYELANMFPGEYKIVPIFIIPSIAMGILLVMPFVGRLKLGGWLPIGHLFNVCYVLFVLTALVVLSIRVIQHDAANAHHQEALATGRDASARIVELARSPRGIPVSGALTLLREDPKTQGPKLFQQHCASCHSYAGGAGPAIRAEKPSAPNLYGFAGRDWIAGFLDPKQIDSPEYFGGTKFKAGDMAKFVKGDLKDVKKEVCEDDKEAFNKMIAALAAEPTRAPGDKTLEEAESLLEDFTCTECHRFHGKGKLGSAPDLTGYGSREWLAAFVADPTHQRFYRKENDRMPSYVKFPSEPEMNVLTARQVEILVDWMQGRWYEPKETCGK
jgi:ubiquinol-cytochrome c reductase cytochrome b subunit